MLGLATRCDCVKAYRQGGEGYLYLAPTQQGNEGRTLHHIVLYNWSHKGAGSFQVPRPKAACRLNIICSIVLSGIAGGSGGGGFNRLNRR
jgi:hypothetical protein